MRLTIDEMKTHFMEAIQDLIDGKEDIIIIIKDNKPVVQMTSISERINKRVGIAKKEMNGFDISLEEFNSISTFDEF